MTLEDEDIRDIRKFVRGGEISFISCTLIETSEEDDFLKVYDVLDDYDETLQKINSYDSVAIMPDETDSLELCCEELFSEEKDLLICDYTFSMFCEEFGHSIHVPTKVKKENYKVIFNDDSDCVLPYRENVHFSEWFHFRHNDKTYIKGVYLPKLVVTLPYVAFGVMLKNAKFNLQNRIFYPTVSRDSMNETLNQKLGYAIGKALHLWILENGDLSAEKKSLLRDFILKCYPENNECLCESNAL